ncbi:MAG: hypothetical protein HY696_12130 [Deltaproteobacteria bacterium]|nr:hypothetical protein [Deltaproteobacteria bacterium]
MFSIGKFAAAAAGLQYLDYAAATHQPPPHWWWLTATAFASFIYFTFRHIAASSPLPHHKPKQLHEHNPK